MPLAPRDAVPKHGRDKVLARTNIACSRLYHTDRRSDTRLDESVLMSSYVNLSTAQVSLFWAKTPLRPVAIFSLEALSLRALSQTLQQKTRLEGIEIGGEALY